MFLNQTQRLSMGAKTTSIRSIREGEGGDAISGKQENSAGNVGSIAHNNRLFVRET